MKIISSILLLILTVFPFLNPLFVSSINPQEGNISVLRQDAWAPRVYKTADGMLIAGYETAHGIKTVKSDDNGETWSCEAQASFFDDLSCANINFYCFDDVLYMAYRATGKRINGFFSSLQVSCSGDFGKTWIYHSTIAEYTEESGNYRGVWEPYLGEINGKLVCFYANDSTSVTSMQNLETLTRNGEMWTDRKIISNGEEHNSRDGMPVWTVLPDGKFVCFFESTKYRYMLKPFVIQMIYSSDGTVWSEPTDVYVPKTKNSKASAPGVCMLSDNRIAVTFQTDEDKAEKGDSSSIAKLITVKYKDINSIRLSNFSKPQKIFTEEYDSFSTWGGVFYSEGTMYYSAGTAFGATMNSIKY